jgi:DNA-binding NarL/FixJ family response regulator
MRPVIRLVVAGDHAGLERAVDGADDVVLVGTAAGGAEALALCRRERPDVLLIDLGLDGAAAARELAAAHPEIRVVVLTTPSDRDRILDALAAGAIGYLPKDTAPGDLLAGVRAASRGEAPRAASAGPRVRTERRAAGELSARELDVLALVGAGLPNKQIASRLAISEKTVKNHLTSIFRALGLDDRTQAALWAQRHGIVDRGLTAPGQRPPTPPS